MGKKNITISATILVLIVIGMFVFTYLKKQELQAEPSHIRTIQKDDTTPYGSITHVDAKHFFENNVHTLVGEILMPTPCDLLEWNSRVLESNPEMVIIDFDVVNHTKTCTSTETPQHFSVSFSASEQAHIRARIMGREVTLNLISPAEGENVEDIKLP